MKDKNIRIKPEVYNELMKLKTDEDKSLNDVLERLTGLSEYIAIFNPSIKVDHPEEFDVEKIYKNIKDNLEIVTKGFKPTVNCDNMTVTSIYMLEKGKSKMDSTGWLALGQIELHSIDLNLLKICAKNLIGRLEKSSIRPNVDIAKRRYYGGFGDNGIAKILY